MIRAEVVYAVREELAARVKDVLARRVGVQFYSWRRFAQKVRFCLRSRRKHKAWGVSPRDQKHSRFQARECGRQRRRGKTLREFAATSCRPFHGLAIQF